MADLFSIGSSALLAYSNALATTSNNIANVNTPGYSRQRVDLQSRIGSFTGDGVVGSGVEQAGIQRLTDQFINTRLYGDASGVGREGMFSTVAGRVDSLLSDSSTGLSGAMSNFFSAMDAVSASPADPAARTALIGAASSLTDRFNQLSSQFDGMEQEVSSRMTQTVTDVNGLASKIADLNQRIAVAQAQSGQAPNELLDQREQLITQIAGKVGVTTLPQDDGSINVFVQGHALVLGASVNQLSIAPTPGDTRGRVDAYFGSGASAIRLGAGIGGELGGLIDSRKGVLDPAEGQIGRIAVGLSQQFNQLQSQGVDLNGATGTNFFASLSPQVQSIGGNTGSATLAATYANVSQLTGDDYRIKFDGTNWTMTDLAKGTAVTLSGAGTAGNPFVGDGVSFVVSGSANAGDSFVMRSTSAAAGQVQVAISDPAKIAAAAAGSGANSSDNTNARAMAALRSSGVLDGGTASFAQSYTSLVASTGTVAQQAKFRSDAQTALQTSDQAQRDSVSGVNLDEEAANMVRFQQAYQAAAQIIATAQAAFDSLLNALKA